MSLTQYARTCWLSSTAKAELRTNATLRTFEFVWYSYLTLGALIGMTFFHTPGSPIVRVMLDSVFLMQALRRHVQRRVRCTQFHWHRQLVL